MLDYAHVNALRGWRESGEGAERILGTNSRHCGSIRALKLIRIRPAGPIYSSIGYIKRMQTMKRCES